MFVILLNERSRLKVVVYVERLCVVSIRVAGGEQDSSSVVFEILLLVKVSLGFDANAVVAAALVMTRSVTSPGVENLNSEDCILHTVRHITTSERLETNLKRQTVPSI